MEYGSVSPSQGHEEKEESKGIQIGKKMCECTYTLQHNHTNIAQICPPKSLWELTNQFMKLKDTRLT